MACIRSSNVATIVVAILLYVGPIGEARGTPLEFCTNYLGEQIGNGIEFIPSADDLCYRCTCDGGFPVACSSVFCSPPHCKFYEEVQDECCKFICLEYADGPEYNETGGPLLPDEGYKSLNAANLPLRLVASTVTSFLILALLLFMIHRLRQRRTLIMLRRLNAERQEEDTVAYLPQTDNVDIGIEFPPYEDPPPPYSPPKPPYIPEGEAPPPYDNPDGDPTADDNIMMANNWRDGDGRQCGAPNGNTAGNGSLSNGNGVLRNGTIRNGYCNHGRNRNSVEGRNMSQHRESGTSHYSRQSTGSLCTRSTNTGDEDESAEISEVPVEVADESLRRSASREPLSYGLSVSVAALGSSTDSSPSSVVLRLESQYHSSDSSSLSDSDNSHGKIIVKKPNRAISNFIKRSDSIEIRRGSSSPRNSFYLSSMDNSMETSMETSTSSAGSGSRSEEGPHTAYNMSASLHSNGSSSVKSKISDDARPSTSGCGRNRETFDSNRVSYPLGWDPSVHSPTMDGSSTDSSSPPSAIFHRPSDSFHRDTSSIAERKSLPPTSLDLPLQNIYASQYRSDDVAQANRSDETCLNSPALPPVSTIPGPRHGYTASSPSSEHSNSHRTDLNNGAVQSSRILASISASSALAGVHSNHITSSPRVHSPLSPLSRPFIRSGSVTSQASMFSVCSETGERKRPGFSLPPEVLRNDVQYPLSPLTSLHSAPMPELHSLPSDSSLASREQNESRHVRHTVPTHDLDYHNGDIDRQSSDQPSPVELSHGESRAESEMVQRVRPKISYRDPEELESNNHTWNLPTSGSCTRHHDLDETHPKFAEAMKSTPSRPEDHGVAAHKSKSKKKRPMSVPGHGEPNQNVADHVRSGDYVNPDQVHQSNSGRRINPHGAVGGAPQFKQYGFIDDPEVLKACKDNKVYPEAGDKVLNMSLFERLRNRSLSRERRDLHNRNNDSSGYSSKSTGDKSPSSSIARSRSGSRSRSRSRERVHRRHNEPQGAMNIDNRRWSEPPNVNLVHQGIVANGVANHPEVNIHSPRRRKKRRSQVDRSDLNAINQDTNGDVNQEPRNSHYVNNNVVNGQVQYEDSQPSTSKATSQNCKADVDKVNQGQRSTADHMNDDPDNLDR